MSHFSSKNSYVVVTGASSGIGWSTAEVFAENGFNLILGARRHEKLLELQYKYQSQVDVICLPLDVRSADSIQKFFECANRAPGQLDIIINNAGLALGRDHVVQGHDRDWTAMIETNFLGLLRITRTFLPQMIARSKGHIINIGSVAGFQSYAGGAAYAGTKHAVRAISQALREELLGTGVRVTEVDPGMVETEFSVVRFSGDPAKAKDVYSGMTPLTGKDVAECIYFAATRPYHVNMDTLVIQPTDQASVNKVHRRSP